MSFFISRYRERSTWPPEYDLREPSYTEFYLHLGPRHDVHFSWAVRTVRLLSAIYGEDWEKHNESFSPDFDGKQFMSRGFLQPAKSSRSRVKVGFVDDANGLAVMTIRHKLWGDYVGTLQRL